MSSVLAELRQQFLRFRRTRPQPDPGVCQRTRPGNLSPPWLRKNQGRPSRTYFGLDVEPTYINRPSSRGGLLVPSSWVSTALRTQCDRTTWEVKDCYEFCKP